MLLEHLILFVIAATNVVGIAIVYLLLLFSMKLVKSLAYYNHQQYHHYPLTYIQTN